MKPNRVKFMLMASDMNRAVSFYRHVFGFEELMVSDYWSELKHGDAIIALHGGYGGGRNPIPLTLEFDDVLAVAERIVAAGGKIIDAPRQREGEPILLGVFRDPEGNEIFITQYVGH